MTSEVSHVSACLFVQRMHRTALHCTALTAYLSLPEWLSKDSLLVEAVLALLV